MPEATAIKSVPSSPEIVKPVNVENQLNGIRAQAGSSSDEALGNKGQPHNPVPIKEQKPRIPGYVPSGETIDTRKKGSADVPDSHESNKFFDDLAHRVPNINLTNEPEQSASPRTGSTVSFLEHARNKKKGLTPGFVKKFKAWLRDEAA